MSKEIFENRYFSEAEALGKVGERIQTRVEFSGVPKGNKGLVISADEAGISRIQGITRTVYDVAIRWDSERDEAHGEVAVARVFNKPLVDWFTKEEYERYLDELPKVDEDPGNK